MTATSEPMLRADSQTAARFAAVLNAGLRAALDGAWRTLEGWGREYQSRIARGAAPQSWSLHSQRHNDAMSVTLTAALQGRAVDAAHPLIREFGTDRIAAGRLSPSRSSESSPAASQAVSGQAPVSPSFGDRRSHVDVISHAFSDDAVAQRQSVRAVGAELAPQIVKDLEKAVAEGFRAAANSSTKAG